MRFHSVLLILLSTYGSQAVEISLGPTKIRGQSNSGIDLFAGIPFAEPPIGQLRLKPPVLKTKYKEKVLDASTFGHACLQPPIGAVVPPETRSEDCLTLNIWRPEGVKPNAKLPVQLWTFGGGFSAGGSSLDDGSLLVQQSIARGTDMIFISHNYRLGPLGFPQGEEAKREKALNLGIKDHLAALKWIHENIGAFGGDKNKVTISGLSSGSISSSILLLDQKTKSLARGAILQSGLAASTLLNKPEVHNDHWKDFVAGIPECAHTAGTSNTFQCLRGLPEQSTSLADHIAPPEPLERVLYAWLPVIEEDKEGGVYPDYPSRLFEQGKVANIPTLMGSVLDEATAFVGQYLPYVDWTTESMESLLRSNYSPIVNASEKKFTQTISDLVASYSDNPAAGSPYNTGSETFGLGTGYKKITSIIGDLWVEGQRRYWNQQYAKKGVKTYGYLFTQPQPLYPGYYGVTHTTDLAYFFGGYNTSNPSDAVLAQKMRDYWISFVVSQNPSDSAGSDRPVWQPYTVGNEAVMQIEGDNMTMIPDTHRQIQIKLANDHSLIFHR